MQAILLGLGTLLLAVAGVVFTAVNWSRMDAATQGVVLLALTAAVATATILARRRGLPATAEALGLVTLVLALVDGHAARLSIAPDAGLASFWAFGLAVVALLAWGVSVAAQISSTRLVAVVMGQIPVLLALVAHDADAAVAGVALLAQVALVLWLTAPWGPVGVTLDRATRACAVVPAAYLWVVVTGTAVTWLSLEGARYRPEVVGVVVLAAAVAAWAAVCWAHLDGVRSVALVAATATGVPACGWLARLLVDGDVAWAVVGIAAACVVGVGLRSNPRWGGAPAGASVWMAGVVTCSLLAPIDEVFRRLGAVVGEPWALQAAERAVSPSSTRSGGIDAVALVIHLAGLGLLAWAIEPRVSRRASGCLRLGLSVLVVGLAPMVVPLSIGGAATSAWIAAAVALAAVELWLRSEVRSTSQTRTVLRAGALTSALLLGLASAWSAGSDVLSVVDGTLVALAALWICARAWRSGDEVTAAVAAGLAVLAVGVEAGLVAAISGSGGGTAVAWASAAGLAASTVALVVAPRRLSSVAEISGWYLHGLALFVIVTSGTGADGGATWRIALLSGALAAGVRAARDGRDHLAVLAACELLALWWLELFGAAVVAPEPYTLALAGVLAVAGQVAARNVPAGVPRPGSWATAGPALVVAALPTTWVSLIEPDGVRPLVALVVGMAVLAFGAFHGRRAFVDVGAATVGVLALARLLPVLADAPNWLTIGLTGASLVAVGATFEQRRQDARGVRDRYGALR